MKLYQQQLADNLDDINRRIAKACARAGRSPSQVTLVAVSKRQTVEKMLLYSQLCRSRGAPVIFGENYVQEAHEKRAQFGEDGITMHLIGNLQSNKSKRAVEIFNVVQTVDSEKIATLLNREAMKAGKQLPVLIEVNISSDTAKAGVSPDQVEALACFVLQQCSSLRFDGLMTVTAIYEQAEDARPDFKALRVLSEKLLRNSTIAANFKGRQIELSMGMSADFDVAIEEGATMVRVGSALFGARA